MLCLLVEEILVVRGEWESCRDCARTDVRRGTYMVVLVALDPLEWVLQFVSRQMVKGLKGLFDLTIIE
jgi:hypothetical protein